MNVDVEKILANVYYLTSRSGGPGGQHANKVETKVTLIFTLSEACLSAHQMELIYERIPNKINSKGEIHISSQKFKSQHRNKELVNQQLIDLLNETFKPAAIRKKTKKSKAQQQKRLDDKKHRSEIKKARKKPES